MIGAVRWAGRRGHGAIRQAKEPFLRGFLKPANGLPSHDTFNRLFRQLDLEQLRAAFQPFMASFSKTLEMAQIATGCPGEGGASP